MLLIHCSSHTLELRSFYLLKKVLELRFTWHSRSHITSFRNIKNIMWLIRENSYQTLSSITHFLQTLPFYLSAHCTSWEFITKKEPLLTGDLKHEGTYLFSHWEGSLCKSHGDQSKTEKQVVYWKRQWLSTNTNLGSLWNYIYNLDAGIYIRLLKVLTVLLSCLLIFHSMLWIDDSHVPNPFFFLKEREELPASAKKDLQHKDAGKQVVTKLMILLVL